ncbi:MAG: NHL repeat-containing protein [Pirellulaceae bacterium]
MFPHRFNWLFALVLFSLGLVSESRADLLVSNFDTDSVLRFDDRTGRFIDVFISGGGLDGPRGLATGPDGNIYVSSQLNNRILRYDGRSGAFMDTFIASGLDFQTDLAFGQDGNLYVADGTQIERYSGQTGAALGRVSTVDAEGLAFHTDGRLFASGLQRVYQITPFEREFGRGGHDGIFGPRGIDIGPDGLLYLSSQNSQEIKRFDPNTRSFVDDFIGAGANGVFNPQGLRFGPDGALYVADDGTNSIRKFSASTGAFEGDFASGGGLSSPTFFIFHNTAVPEPSSATLVAFIGLSLCHYRRRR